MTGGTLPPELIARAGLTRKELDALRLWDPGRCGYGSVALALDISKEAAVGRIKRALRKLERASRV